jgi:poly(hydroxyalkanoate) granule-associated protein
MTTTAPEEVEVPVERIEEPQAADGPWMVEGVRRLLMASLGAVALTLDEVEHFVGKLVERGELAQRDGEKLLHEFQDRMHVQRPSGEKVGERVEQGMEEFLNRLNIPSKRDIDDLSAKIAQLSARVEELKKTK